MPAELRLRYLVFWRSLGLVFVLTALYLSLMPYHFRSSISFIDKIYHLLTYTGLMLWFTQLYPRRRLPGLAIGLILFGVIVEILQSFTSYRSAEWQDALANSAGVAIGWGLYMTPAGRLVQLMDAGIQRLRHLTTK